MNTSKIIKLTSLSTGYKTKTVSGNINASLNSGQLTCLLGPNGAGKSTLLRTLSAFQPPISGQIEILGKPLESYSDKELSTLIGVVLTERIDVRNMTVHDLVGLGRSPYTGFWGNLSEKDSQLVDSAMDMVGIREFSERMIQTLSDGERQKVMIAKALAQETPIIFLDEPTAFLDYPSKVEIMQLLHKLSHNSGKTIFMSTHDLELALQISDMVWLLDQEHGLETGTPEDLTLSGNLQKFFVRKGISFHAESGQFRIDNECNRVVSLEAQAALQELVVKALHRNGIRIANESEIANIQVKATMDNGVPCFTVTDSTTGLMQNAGSFQDMLSLL